jgi:hypothetical protein
MKRRLWIVTAATSAALMAAIIALILLIVDPFDGGSTNVRMCGESWRLYQDPNGYFSICYPRDWEATIAPPDADLSAILEVSSTLGERIVLYRRPVSDFAGGEHDVCAVAPGWPDQRVVEETIAGVRVSACTGHEYLVAPGLPPLLTTVAELPIGEDQGYLTLFWTRRDGDSNSAASKEVVDTLELGTRAVRAREDCPPDWRTFGDALDVFSLCYPAEYSVSTSEAAVRLFSPSTGNGTVGDIAVVLSWDQSPRYGAGIPSTKTCSIYTDIVEGPPESSTFIKQTVDGRVAPACFTVGRIQSSLHGLVGLARDGSAAYGYLHFTVAFAGPSLDAVPATAKAVLETVRLNVR